MNFFQKQEFLQIISEVPLEIIHLLRITKFVQSILNICLFAITAKP